MSAQWAAGVQEESKTLIAEGCKFTASQETLLLVYANIPS